MISTKIPALISLALVSLASPNLAHADAAPTEVGIVKIERMKCTGETFDYVAGQGYVQHRGDRRIVTIEVDNTRNPAKGAITFRQNLRSAATSSIPFQPEVDAGFYIYSSLGVKMPGPMVGYSVGGPSVSGLLFQPSPEGDRYLLHLLRGQGMDAVNVHSTISMQNPSPGRSDSQTYSLNCDINFARSFVMHHSLDKETLAVVQELQKQVSGKP